MAQQLELKTTTVPSNSWPRDLLLLLLGVMILSCSAIFTRLSEVELTPLATIFDRFWIASMALALMNGLKGLKQISTADVEADLTGESKLAGDTPWVEGLLMLVLAIAIAARAGSWAWSLTQTSVANSNLLHNMTPIFATLGGWLFLGHTFDRRYLMGLLLAVSGVVAIGIQDFNVTDDSFIGDIAALMSSVFYAINFLIIEKLRRKLSTTAIMTGSCFWVSVILVPGIWMEGSGFIPESASVWAAVICLGLLSQVLGQGILAYVLSRMNSGHVSLFLLLEPVITALLAWMIFGERLSVENWLAFVVVLTGLYLANLSQGASGLESQG
ncbi:DMT family transporter [Lyngbya confervoides]|uniref:DMT family transporter n=1 Tax=Lyngbya confervoides BDU141951 TaxID=1574623 RepID=A0ABD4T389_9CYAN|nr:DMT family transporter [Lyngbya confervoides]MCM1983124.1 DMT family transporter [Lyngbya confervoides BDU141951]